MTDRMMEGDFKAKYCLSRNIEENWHGIVYHIEWTGASGTGIYNALSTVPNLATRSNCFYELCDERKIFTLK